MYNIGKKDDQGNANPEKRDLNIFLIDWLDLTRVLWFATRNCSNKSKCGKYSLKEVIFLLKLWIRSFSELILPLKTLHKNIVFMKGLVYLDDF